jgi:hypothetical protein
MPPAAWGCKESAAWGGAVPRLGAQLVAEPVTGVVFVGGKLMYAKDGGLVDMTSALSAGLAFVSGQAGNLAATVERFRRLGWNELP